MLQCSLLSNLNMKAGSSKFYFNSLTLLVPILKLINEDLILAEISKVLDLEKSHVTYYIKKALKHGLVNEKCRSRIKVFELTPHGKNFLVQYEKRQEATSRCRAENVRFKAPVLRMPSVPLDWKRVEMKNWSQYNGEVDGIRVHLNEGSSPSIEFIPPAIYGDNIWDLRTKLEDSCKKVARKLEQILGMEIGMLEFEPRPEWVVHDPLADIICKHHGQITIDGLGKINASKPFRRGAIEYFDPSFAVDYYTMPRRLSNIEKMLEELLKQNSKSE